MQTDIIEIKRAMLNEQGGQNFFCKQIVYVVLSTKKAAINSCFTKCILSGEFLYTDFLPIIKERRNSTIKIKNKTLAIPAALAAIPPKPKIAAMTATTKKITVQRNMINRF